jgi:hypothetical protein
MVGMRSHHDWYAFAMSGDGIDGVEAGKRRSSLLLSEEVLEETINQPIGCVFDLQTGLTTARVDCQVLKLAHVHVDVDVMKAVKAVVRKPLKLRSNKVVVRRGTCLVKVLVVGVIVQSDKGAQTNINEANQISKDRRTTDVKRSTRVVGGV